MTDRFGPNAVRVSNESLKEASKVEALKPGEKDFARAFGEGRIERYHVVNGRKVPGPDANGRYKWRMPFKGSTGGKMSHDASLVGEMMGDFMRADSERQARNQSKVERLAVKDDAGSVHYLAAEHEAAANRNGWHSPGRIVGLLAREVYGDFCPACDRLKVWCECRGTA